jgi:hypothetical protein
MLVRYLLSALPVTSFQPKDKMRVCKSPGFRRLAEYLLQVLATLCRLFRMINGSYTPSTAQLDPNSDLIHVCRILTVRLSI